MKKLLCNIFGHNWIYGEFKGIQNQPTVRACNRCKKVEKFYGKMTHSQGTFGQFWFSDKDWRSDEEEKMHQANDELNHKRFKDLTSK